MRNVTVYSRPMCGYCTTLQQELERRGVPFERVNIWDDREQAEVVRQANGGDELVPTVQVGERFFGNPSIDEVLSALEG